MEENNSIVESNSWDIVQTVENPYDVPVHTDINKRKLLASEALIAGVLNGSDPREAYNTVMRDAATFSESNLVNTAKQQDLEALSGAVEILATNDPVTLKASANDLVTMYSDIENTYSADNKLAPYIAAVKQFPGADTADDSAIKDVAANKYMHGRIAELFDEDYDWSDKSVDFLGVLAWPDLSYNVSQTFGDVMGKGSVESYLNTSDIVIKFAQALNDMPPEKKIEMFDTLYEKIKGVEDNKLKTAMLLMSAMGQTSPGEEKFNAAFDKLDQLGIGYLLGSGVARTVKSFGQLRNIVKVSKDFKEAAVAADIAAASDEGAATIGVARLDAAASADPSASALADILDGAPQGVATKISKEWQVIDNAVAEASNVVQEGLGLTDVERVAAAEKRVKVLEKRDGVENVVSSVGDDGIVLTFDKVDDAGETVATTIKVPYTVDDVTGTFVNKGVTLLGQLGKGVLNSPNYLQGSDRNLLVQAFERTMFAGAKVKHELNTALTKINKGLTTAESENVSKILLKGDDTDKVFSYKELVQDGIGGIKLTEKEFSAYAGTRKLMDEVWRLKNDEIRKSYTAKGFKEVKVGDTPVVAKPYDLLQPASAAYRSSNTKVVSVPEPLDGRSFRIDELTTEKLSEYYDQGYTLVRTSESGSYVNAGETLAEWALVRRNNIGDLPVEVLNKKVGYIPRAYENAHFFVKQNRVLDIGGVQTAAGMKTLRYFDNITDAEKYVDELEAAAKIDGTPFDRSQYSVLGDREILAADIDGESVRMFGGMYTGARADEAIKFGLNGEAGKRVEPLEAIQNYINHIGNRYPLAEYRLGIERRWMNHAKTYGALPRDYFGSFHEAIGVVENSTASPMVKTKLKNAHGQIEYMNKVQTPNEQAWSGTVRAIGTSLEKVPGVGKSMAKYMYRLDHTSPVDAIRSATFNTMLGMYNWSQLFVQASGATIALAIKPQHATKGMTSMVAFGLLDNIKNPAARAGAIERIAKMPGYEDVASEYALWKKSGMFDSAVNANADVSTVFNGLPYDAGMVRKLWTNGTLPYTMGELANMRISFGIALDEWKNLNKGKKLDDSALKDIVARTENFRLSMSRANTSTWQRNAMSVPTQFMQINARFFEAMLGNQFKTEHKVALLAGQTMMFGASGLPFGDVMYGTVNNWIGRDVSKLSPEQITLERRGMLGWLVNNAMGVDANVAGRMAISAGVVQQIIDISTEPTQIADILLGPSASLKDNTFNLFESLMMTGKSMFTVDDLDATDAQLMLQANLAALAQLPASTRNLLLANDLYNNDVYRTRNGKSRFDTDANFQTVVSQAIGFQQQTKADYWEIVMGQKKGEERMRGDVDRITMLYLNMMRFADTDEKQSKANRLAIDATILGYPDMQDRIKVMTAVRERLKKESDPIGKEVLEILKMHTSKFVDQNSVYSPLTAERIQDSQGNN